MTNFGYDDVNGVIIGGDTITGTLHRYDTGVQQGPTFVGDTDEDVQAQAVAWFTEHRFLPDGTNLWPVGLELRLR